MKNGIQSDKVSFRLGVGKTAAHQSSGVTRLRATRADHNIAFLFIPQICLQDFQMNEDHASDKAP